MGFGLSFGKNKTKTTEKSVLDKLETGTQSGTESTSSTNERFDSTLFVSQAQVPSYFRGDFEVE